MTNENRKCTKAMAAVEARFCGNQKRSAVITQEEFRAISDYIEDLEDGLQIYRDAQIKLSQENAELWFRQGGKVYK